jgi:serine protease Do
MRKWILCCVAATLLTAGCAQSTIEREATAIEGVEIKGSAAARTPGFRRIVKGATDKVFPAVVFIKCLRESHESGKKVSQEVSGSGVVISAAGEALTNWHVIDKAVEVRCLLFDGRAMDAEVLGSDKDTDLALVKLKLPEGDTVPAAEIGDSTVLKEGDFVMAMGAPWGLSRSVSIGIVSCTRRYLPDHSEYSLWLQTDASISPGNSGGPLVNTDGEVVGINTRGIMQGGDMGFAIPSETVRFVAGQIREHGKVNWSWTGLQLQALKDFNRNIYFDADEGVVVAATDPESPARRAGILANDRIVRINGRPVTATNEENLPAVRKLVGELPKHEAAAVELVRKGETVAVELTPREKGEVEGEELDCPRWDVTVKEINQFDNPDLYYYRKEGVFIYGVKRPGNGSNAGLESQDIILKIDGKSVKTLDDVRAIHKASLENVEKNHKIVVSALRNGLMRQVVLDFMRDYEKE